MDDQTNSGESVANACRSYDACLIAAAPDLLDRLRDMTEQHRCKCGHPACNRCEDARRNDAVIAAATGVAGGAT